MRKCIRTETYFGTVSLSDCKRVCEDGQGRVFVIAAKIDRDQAGIAIVEGEGKARKLLGERFVAGWEISYQGGSPPILTNSGNRAWLAFRETTEAPKLLDLKTAEFVDSLPHPEFSRLRAVSDDGRVFTSVALPMGDRPIMAYTRGAHNMQNPLKVSHITVLSPEWAITDAGTIWAIDASGSPACFNGQEWQAVPTGSKGNTQVLLPGRGQVMLVCDDRQATFYSGSTEVASGELFDVLQQQRALLRKAFGQCHRSESIVQRTRKKCAVVADTGGNIWFLQSAARAPARLLVDIASNWQDTNEALTAAGSPAGVVVDLALIGDGSKVRVIDRDPRTGRLQLFLGDAVGKMPHFSSVQKEPVFVDQNYNAHILRDRNGAIWLDNFSVADKGAFQIDHTGVLQKLRNMERPFFIDQSENVWFAKNRGPIWDQFNIWRNGEIVQTLKIPQADLDTFLFSDRPGSVYAWTSLGVQHFTSTNGSHDQYRPGSLYPVEGLIGQKISYGYSSHGYLATIAALDARQGPNYYLYLVKLPNPDSDGQGNANK